MLLHPLQASIFIRCVETVASKP